MCLISSNTRWSMSWPNYRPDFRYSQGSAKESYSPTTFSRKYLLDSQIRQSKLREKSKVNLRWKESNNPHFHKSITQSWSRRGSISSISAFTETPLLGSALLFYVRGQLLSKNLSGVSYPFSLHQVLQPAPRNRFQFRDHSSTQMVGTRRSTLSLPPSLKNFKSQGP